MRTKDLLLVALLCFFSYRSIAQETEKRFGFELSTGASFALSKPGDTQLNPGFGAEGIFHYRFLTNTGIFAGWGWNRFGADQSFAGENTCFEETGYLIGLELKQAIGNKSLLYYLRFAGLYNHLELENAAGEIIGDSGHGLGFQLAAGIDYKLGEKWSLTPGLKFNSLSRSIEIDNVDTNLSHRYISIRIGLLRNF